MRYNRWLVIIISIFLLLNIGFLVAIKYVKIGDLLTNYVANLLASEMNCDFHIGYYSLNDKQFFATDIEIYHREKLYRIYIEKIHIEFNILQLIYIKKRPIQFITGVRVYNPAVDIMVLTSKGEEPLPDEKEKGNKKDKKKDKGEIDFNIDLSSIKYPNTYQYFSNIDVYDGQVNLIIDLPSFAYEKHIKNINISVENKDLITTANISVKDTLEAMMEIDIMKPIVFDPILHMSLWDCYVRDMDIPGIGVLNSQLELDLTNEKGINLKVNVKDSEFAFTLPALEGMITQMPALNIEGSEKNLSLQTSPIVIKNGQKFALDTATATLAGSIVNPLVAKTTDFLANVKVENISIPTELIDPSSRASVNLLGQGNYEKIAAKVRVESPRILATIPLSDTLNIVEDAQDVEVVITSENVLSEVCDISIGINEVFNSRIKATGQFHPYDLNGELTLAVDDFLFIIPTTRSTTPQSERVQGQRGRTATDRTNRTEGTQRGVRRGAREREQEQGEMATLTPAERIVDFVRFSLTSHFDFQLYKNNELTLNSSEVRFNNISGHYNKLNLSGSEIAIDSKAHIDMKRPFVSKDKHNPFQADGVSHITYKLYNDCVQGELNINLKEYDFQFNALVSSLNLKQVNSAWPTYTVTSDVKAVYNSKEIDLKVTSTSGDYLIKDYFIIADAGFYYSKSADSLAVNLEMRNSFINYTPIFAKLLVNGNKNSIHTEEFNINDAIGGDLLVEIPEAISIFLDDMWVEHYFGDILPGAVRRDLTATAPANKFSLPQMNLRLYGDEIDISRFSQYFLNYSDAILLHGDMSFAVSYNNISSASTPLHANLSASGLSFEPLRPFSVQLSCKGDIDNIIIDNAEVLIDSLSVLSATGAVTEMGQKILLDAFFNADVGNIQDGYDLTGAVSGSVAFLKDKEDITANIKVDTETINFQKKPLFRATLDITQYTDRLQILIAEFLVGPEFATPSTKKQKKGAPPPAPIPVAPLMVVDISGAWNYNFFTDTLYPITDSMRVYVSGDPLKVAQNFTEFIIDGKSEFLLGCSVIIDDEGFQFEKGSLELKNAEARVLTQSEVVRNINMLAEITQNNFLLKDLRLSLGKGSLFIKNQISGNNNDIVIGDMNFGNFLINTDRTGLQVYAPGYMPTGTTANLVIRGRNSTMASIIGPIDEMHIAVEVELYNSNIIFPESTDNLLKMFDFVRSEIRSSGEANKQEIPELPFTLDLMARLSRNNRYVTYPMNLRLDENIYAHVLFDGKAFIINEASIRAESGTLELFGTFMDMDHAEVMLSRFDDVPNIDAMFYKKVLDGSTITLKIFTERVIGASIMERLKFSLEDDAGNTSIGDILAKLRYGTTLDKSEELDGTSVPKDLAINLLGVSVASAFLNQYLAPLENRFRRFLRLDNMSINTGLVQNMVNEKVWEDFSLTETNIFNTNFLLNDLQIQMGRYVNRDFFLEYELNFQEGTELVNKPGIFLYHTLGLRYDLPYQFKIRYSYEFKPLDEKNAHEVFLMRTVKF